MQDAGPPFRLLLVTDRKRTRRPLPDVVEEALAAVPPGRVALQLREKDLEARALYELAMALHPICRARAVPLVVNDRVDLALALDLEGVHLPQASFAAIDARRLLGPSKLVGVSCHAPAEVEAARDEGASYATFGPVFDTPSKREFGPPVGLELLSQASTLGLPLFALGGIVASNAAEGPRRGAKGVAVIGAWLGDGSPRKAVEGLLAKLGS